MASLDKKPDYMGSGRRSRFTLNLLSVQRNTFMSGQREEEEVVTYSLKMSL